MTREHVSIDRLKRVGDEHLVYEFEMFHDTASILGTEIVQNDLTIRNAIIEAFVIHMRNLLKFFFDTQPLKTDVTASDFYEDPEDWINIRATLNDKEAVERICRRANKEVAHLTYDRLDVKPEEKAWLSPGKIGFNLIVHAQREFLTTVPMSRIGDKLAQAKRQVMEQ